MKTAMLSNITDAMRQKLQAMTSRGSSANYAGERKRRSEVAQAASSLFTKQSRGVALSRPSSASQGAGFALQPPLSPGATKSTESQASARTSETSTKPSTPSPFQKGLSRDEQVALLQRSEDLILGRIHRAVDALKILQELSSSSFDSDLTELLLLRRGLLQHIAGNDEGCIDDMLEILCKSSNNRSALVYCQVAEISDSFRVIRREKFDFIEDRKTDIVWQNTKNYLSPADDDIFAHLVRLTRLSEIGNSSEILEKLQSLTQQAPGNSLAWSMLAAHFFFMRSFLLNQNALSLAEDAAYRALKLRPNDKLSMSVLWSSGSADHRKKDFDEAVSWYRLSKGDFSLYEAADIGLERAFDKVTIPFDQHLKLILTSQKNKKKSIDSQMPSSFAASDAP